MFGLTKYKETEHFIVISRSMFECPCCWGQSVRQRDESLAQSVTASWQKLYTCKMCENIHLSGHIRSVCSNQSPECNYSISADVQPPPCWIAGDIFGSLTVTTLPTLDLIHLDKSALFWGPEEQEMLQIMPYSYWISDQGKQYRKVFCLTVIAMSETAWDLFLRSLISSDQALAVWSAGLLHAPRAHGKFCKFRV